MDPEPESDFYVAGRGYRGVMQVARINAYITDQQAKISVDAAFHKASQLLGCATYAKRLGIGKPWFLNCPTGAVGKTPVEAAQGLVAKYSAQLQEALLEVEKLQQQLQAARELLATQVEVPA